MKLICGQCATRHSWTQAHLSWQVKERFDSIVEIQLQLKHRAQATPFFASHGRAEGSPQCNSMAWTEIGSPERSWASSCSGGPPGTLAHVSRCHSQMPTGRWPQPPPLVRRTQASLPSLHTGQRCVGSCQKWRACSCRLVEHKTPF